MNVERFLSFFIFTLFLGACSVRSPMTAIYEGASLTAYKTVEITPVSNDTGKELDFDVATAITEHLRSLMRSKGYRLTDTVAGSDDVLIVKSSLTEYESGSALVRWIAAFEGATICTVRSSLIDKRTGNALGEIIVPRIVSGGGLLSVGADRWILGVVASDIVDEVDKRIRGR